jgi:hypothetical protein
MHRVTFWTAAIEAALMLVFISAPLQAQATRTWVSGVGDDANPCSRTSPCKTFAGAISKTAADGQIDCLDPGGFGALTITKSLTIDCHEVFSSVLVAGTNAIVINTDTARNVRLRNLNFSGLAMTGNAGLDAVKIIGSTANTTVILQDLWIDDFGVNCISDERHNGGKLFIGNTQINNCNSGIALGNGGVDASFDNVRVQNSTVGIALGSGKVMINRSTIAGSTMAGMVTGGTSFTVVDNSVISNNAIGIQVLGGTVQLANTDVAHNSTGVSGTVNSFSNNRFSNNGPGGTITAIPPVNTNPSGQQ